MTKTPPSKATPSKIVLPRKLPLLREANPSTTTNLPTITAKDSLASKSSTQLSKKFDAILHQSSTGKANYIFEKTANFYSDI